MSEYKLSMTASEVEKALENARDLAKPVLFEVNGEEFHYYGNSELIPTTQEIVDAVMTNNAYVVWGEYADVSKVLGISGDNAGGIIIYYLGLNGIAHAWMFNTSREECQAAMEKWLS